MCWNCSELLGDFQAVGRSRLKRDPFRSLAAPGSLPRARCPYTPPRHTPSPVPRPPWRCWRACHTYSAQLGRYPRLPPTPAAPPGSDTALAPGAPGAAPRPAPRSAPPPPARCTAAGQDRRNRIPDRTAPAGGGPDRPDSAGSVAVERCPVSVAGDCPSRSISDHRRGIRGGRDRRPW